MIVYFKLRKRFIENFAGYKHGAVRIEVKIEIFLVD